MIVDTRDISYRDRQYRWFADGYNADGANTIMQRYIDTRWLFTHSFKDCIMDAVPILELPRSQIMWPWGIWVKSVDSKQQQWQYIVRCVHRSTDVLYVNDYKKFYWYTCQWYSVFHFYLPQVWGPHVHYWKNRDVLIKKIYVENWWQNGIFENILDILG